jgi:isoquinoline 1-oxidoreductase subunit beta
VIARPPAIGATLERLDDAAARRVPGVRQVLSISSGVAVVADGYWAAEQGRRALQLTWSAGTAPDLDNAAIDRALGTALASPALPVIQSDGAPSDALAAADRRIDAEYSLPYLAHATMEPMVCVADVRDGACTVWAPTQLQWAPAHFGGGAVGVAAERAGVPVSRVTLHSTAMGGGFGRRSELDFVEEAVEVSKAVGAPVKVQWSREDDTRHDWYRPAALHRLRGGVDAEGRPVAWSHDIATPSLLKRFIPGFVPGFVANRLGLLVNGADPTSIEGADTIPYALGARELRCVAVDLPLPLGFWRSVGHSHTAFAVESFIDELAHLAGEDPVRYRRRLLADRPRHLEVLDFAAARSGWGTPLPEGRARGIALHESFGSIVAQVAEVSLDSDGRPRVHRVVCAVNCGLPINPDLIAAQMEGGIVFGLSAALYGAVTLRQGAVQNSNFHDYPLLRADRMPVVETNIVHNADPPMGVGEVATPPIAPAVANAFFALTGQRVRQLPFPAR